MAIILKSFQGHYALTFIVSFFVFSIWEYFVGWLLEKLFHTKYWDYSYYRFQIKGRVCLVNSLTWGVLGVAFTELIHPIVSYLIYPIPINIISIITLALIIYIIIDFCITAIKINDIKLNLDKLSETTSTIKTKIEELKNLPDKAKNNEKIKNALEELKQKQSELKQVIEKKTQRLRLAFPRIKFERLNEHFKKNDKKEADMDKNKRN